MLVDAVVIFDCLDKTESFELTFLFLRVEMVNAQLGQIKFCCS